MMTKEQLRERYLQFMCELGNDHPDTKAARKRYFDCCIAEQGEDRK